MRITITFSAILIGIWIVGMILDVLGLFVGVKFATLGKVILSKVGYYTMKIGEVVINCSTSVMKYIPMIFICEFFKIIK